jgi:hypothetical protein
MIRRRLIQCPLLLAAVLLTRASHAASHTYFFDAYLTIETRAPTDNPVAIPAILEWDGGACADGPLYPLALEVEASDGFYDWAEAYWTQTSFWQTFYDTWVPSDPDDIDYDVYASYFDCADFDWHDDQERLFLAAEAQYPSFVVDVSASSPPDPCPGACTGYETDYTFRLMS